MHAKAAKRFVHGLTHGKTVTIKTKKDKKGKYGRYLAHVILEDGSDLVQRLKENGFEKRKDYK